MAAEFVILFDGVCNLCNGWVQFVIKRDPAGRFAFAPLQSDAARELLRARGAARPLGDTVLLVEKDIVYEESTAALRIARRLSGGWSSLAAVLLVVPRGLRDGVYRLIARNRYRWFGRRDVCMLPTPELHSRFL